MIFWSGWGILSAVAAFIGLLVGGVVSALFGADNHFLVFGLFFAVLANWALCKLLYRKAPRVLFDQQTGQQVLVKPSHSLFFIPSHAWTWVLLVIALISIPISVLGAKENRRMASLPGHESFASADAFVTGRSGDPADGNTPRAKSSAESLSKQLELMSETFFVREKSGESYAAKHPFRVYCQEAPGGLLFLCQVPDRSLPRSADNRDSLSRMAWTLATVTAGPDDEVEPEKATADPLNVTVALRPRLGDYRCTARVVVGAEEPEVLDTVDQANMFYQHFAEPSASTSASDAAEPE